MSSARQPPKPKRWRKCSQPSPSRWYVAELAVEARRRVGGLQRLERVELAARVLERLVDRRRRHRGEQRVEQADLRAREPDGVAAVFAHAGQRAKSFAPRVRQDADRTVAERDRRWPTTGNSNTSNGANALESNTTGSRNAAIGFNALQHNTTGDANVALGSFAGTNATTGDGNVYIGSGIDGVVGEARHTYIRNINSTPVSGGGTEKVTVNLATGLLGHDIFLAAVQAGH